MKQTHYRDASGSAPRLVPVHFAFTDATATTVHIAGTFNDWKPSGKAMSKSEGGHWYQDAVLAPGTYEYCLVVDGRWTFDPLAHDYIPNPFGGRNSVVEVKSHR